MRRILLAALATGATLAAGAALAQEGPPPGPMRQMPAPEDIFKRWDANGDGAVDKAEWTGAGRPEDRFAMIDADKDGKVTLDELKAAFEKMRQRRMQQGGPPPGPPPEGAPPQN
ncbi:EF-hand domain-containing protein [Caulobacter sp.]|uniref:EF-hand domain-containing protein n=1 Tax=Caulobacter sp. TaxID=78 RepID=UPI002B476814|nr:EF-hand domain-containing protein [Caulobacter sp.]HJV42945.1 EF-hand domain-containing protein [Caulobacter sp.]